MRAASMAMVLALALAAPACAGPGPGGAGDTSSKAGPAAPSVIGTGSAQATAPAPPPARKAKNYQGRRLWVVVADSVRTEEQARARWQRLDQVLGMGENTFLVDRSAHYRGLRPGWWVLIEGALTEAGAQDEARFATRGGFRPYVRHVVKTCADSIIVQPK